MQHFAVHEIPTATAAASALATEEVTKANGIVELFLRNFTFAKRIFLCSIFHGEDLMLKKLIGIYSFVGFNLLKFPVLCCSQWISNLESYHFRLRMVNERRRD